MLINTGLPPPRFQTHPGQLGSCFGEPPFPLPLSGGDEDLYSPASCRTNTFDGTSDISPSFEKVEIRDIDKTLADSKFIAQHVRNKDAFENVSIPNNPDKLCNKTCFKQR